MNLDIVLYTSYAVPDLPSHEVDEERGGAFGFSRVRWRRGVGGGGGGVWEWWGHDFFKNRVVSILASVRPPG